MGESGRLLVFEPGPNNLPYLRKNVGEKGNVRVIEMAASDRDGRIKFYLEELTGQNNSILDNYEVLNQNARASVSQASRQEIEVQTTTLDAFFAKMEEKPTFCKIDVEGAELHVLRGMKGILELGKAVLMVEVTAEEKAVWDYLKGFGFRFFMPAGPEILDVELFRGNVFCAVDATFLAEANKLWN